MTDPHDRPDDRRDDTTSFAPPPTDPGPIGWSAVPPGGYPPPVPPPAWPEPGFGHEDHRPPDQNPGDHRPVDHGLYGGQNLYSDHPDRQPVGGYPYGGYSHQPPRFGAHDPTAPYGRDHLTGQPLSDKSKLAAGMLQLFLGWLGVGRFYMGSTAVAVIQLLLFLVGLVTTVVFIGFVLWFALAVWTFIDALVILTGNPRDGRGLMLRS